MKSKSIILVLSLTTFLFLAVNAIAEIPALPKWPQNFEMAAGEWVSYAIPVTQPGKITVNVNWSGVPIVVRIKDGSGRVVLDSGIRNAPKAQFTCTAVEADVARGMIWSVRISDNTAVAQPTGLMVETSSAPVAGGSEPVEARKVASGNVSITYPEIDMAQFQTQIAGLRSRNDAAANVNKTKAQQMVLQNIQKNEQDYLNARRIRFAAQQNQLKSRLTGRILQTTPAAIKRPDMIVAPGGENNAVSPPGASVAVSTSQANPNSIMPTGNAPVIITSGPVSSGGNPAIASVSPNCGYANTSVLIKGSNLRPFKNDTEVWFSFDNNPPIQAQVPSIAPSSTGVDIVATVPTLPQGTVVNSCKIYVKAVDRNPVVETNKLVFNYYQALTPEIYSVDKSATGPYRVITVTGKNFKPDSKVHIVPAPGQDIVASSFNYMSPTKFLFSVPSYSAATTLNGRIYMSTEPVQAPMYTGQPKLISNSVNMTFFPSVCSVSSLSAATGESGENIFITGTGFVNPQVTFMLDQGQQSKLYQSNLNQYWKVVAYTETGILAQVPDIKGIISDVTGKLKICNMDSTGDALVSFVLKPQIIVKPILRAECGWTSFRAKDGNDAWEYSRSANSWIYAHHSSDLFFGHTGDEAYKANFGLVNGWEPDHAEVTYWHTSNGGARAIGAFNWNGGFIAGSVHWWVDAPISTVGYYLTIYIRGPKGVPYRVPYNECEF